MDTRERIEFFKKNGYIIIPSKKKEPEINCIKEKLRNVSMGRRVVQGIELSESINLDDIYKNRDLHQFFKALYGEYNVFNNFHAQINSFTQKAKSSKKAGLHVDGSMELDQKRSYMLNTTPSWCNVGFYLQDEYNSGFGGGIVAMPKMHRLIRFLIKHIGFKATKITGLAQRLTPEKCIKELNTRPGDFVVFDNRLPHASSVGDNLKKIFKKDNGKAQTYIKTDKFEKFAIYVFVGKKKLSQQIYENNFVARKEFNASEDGGFDYVKMCNEFEKIDGNINFI